MVSVDITTAPPVTIELVEPAEDSEELGGRVAIIELTSVGPQGPSNLFIQPTNPNMTSPGLWVDTSDGDITLWVEDGVS